MTNVAAGWYPDPSGDTSVQRYWDGVQWTASTRPVHPGAIPGAAAAQSAYTIAPDAVYPASKSDTSLRLAAFIIMIVGMSSFALLALLFIFLALLDSFFFVFAILFLVPLAWMIPMAIRCWGIYKGKKPNIIVFDVCTIIFCGLLPGLLLLLSKREG